MCHPSNVASRTSSRPHAQIVSKIKDKNITSRVSTIESGISELGIAPATEKNGSIMAAPTKKNFDGTTFCSLIINVTAKPPAKIDINKGNLDEPSK